jgi:hypothetical protein
VLLAIALVLLTLWVIAALLPHRFDDMVHVLLIVGLMLLLLGFAKGRDEALRGSADKTTVSHSLAVRYAIHVV